MHKDAYQYLLDGTSIKELKRSLLMIQSSHDVYVCGIYFLVQITTTYVIQSLYKIILQCDALHDPSKFARNSSKPSLTSKDQPMHLMICNISISTINYNRMEDKIVKNISLPIQKMDCQSQLNIGTNKSCELGFGPLLSSKFQL